jgi:hypothetical protein
MFSFTKKAKKAIEEIESLKNAIFMIEFFGFG